MRKKVAGRAVREHRYLPYLSSVQDISVEEAQPETSQVCATQKHRRLHTLGQEPGTAAGPAVEAGGTVSVSWCPLLKDHMPLD